MLLLLYQRYIAVHNANQNLQNSAHLVPQHIYVYCDLFFPICLVSAS